MKTKISKSQEEVWGWKEKAFKDLEKIPENERVGYIEEKTKDIIERIKKKKKELV
jgi:hypothetical protein